MEPVVSMLSIYLVCFKLYIRLSIPTYFLLTYFMNPHEETVGVVIWTATHTGTCGSWTALPTDP